ncbi:MAG: dihydroxyacetone kinase subunit L [Humibacillus sp.]|nr:dihydroxyacetone kinase subunit L [Humibacillus sp.]MDN5778883.1 dihydroxyacetone kinase subunit L [Humibacillus sp.]
MTADPSVTPSTLTLDNVRGWITSFHTLVTEQKAYLTELDSAIGDADHGTNLSRGMDAVATTLDGAAPAGIGELLKGVGMTLVSTVGGASGPLYGTFFLRFAASAGDAGTLDGEAVGTALTAGLAGVVARGKASVGDKTMVDALTPAVTAWGDAIDNGATLTDAATAARDAARLGSDSTMPLVARKGRASYLGERSAGHLDPGSVSTTLLFTALAQALP